MRLQCSAVPLGGAAGGGRPLVVPAQGGCFGIFVLWDRLVVLDDPLQSSAAALLHSLQIHHEGGHAGELVGNADLRGGRVTSGITCYHLKPTIITT